MRRSVFCIILIILTLGFVISTKTTYNRFLNPYAMIWIAAVLGEERETVNNVMKSIEGARTMPEKCKIVRNMIPFSRIKELSDPLLEELFSDEEKIDD